MCVSEENKTKNFQINLVKNKWCYENCENSFEYIPVGKRVSILLILIKTAVRKRNNLPKCVCYYWMKWKYNYKFLVNIFVVLKLWEWVTWNEIIQNNLVKETLSYKTNWIRHCLSHFFFYILRMGKLPRENICGTNKLYLSRLYLNKHVVWTK